MCTFLNVKSRKVFAFRYNSSSYTGSRSPPSRHRPRGYVVSHKTVALIKTVRLRRHRIERNPWRFHSGRISGYAIKASMGLCAQVRRRPSLTPHGRQTQKNFDERRFRQTSVLQVVFVVVRRVVGRRQCLRLVRSGRPDVAPPPSRRAVCDLRPITYQLCGHALSYLTPTLGPSGG